MNKIPAPTFDDIAAFVALSTNQRLVSFPHLQALVGTVRASYEQYSNAGGRADQINNPQIGDDISRYLLGHYASPPKDLAYISEMRRAHEHLVCPMCGSLHSGTLDHYLPKTGFPVFAVYSKNLIPACKCNTKRGLALTGGNPNERVLHPYFDACLEERLIRAEFSDLGEVPRVSIALTVRTSHTNYAAIRFHVESIVERSAIRNYLADRWSSLYRRPSSVVRAFDRFLGSEGEVQAALQRELTALDEVCRSKNNWQSVFVAGLLEPAVLVWLTARLATAGRGRDSPLEM